MTIDWINLDIIGYVYDTVNEMAVHGTEYLTHETAMDSVISDVSRTLGEAQKLDIPISYDILSRERLSNMYNSYTKIGNKDDDDKITDNE